MVKFVPCRKCIQKENSHIPNGYYKKNDVIVECEHHKEWRLEQELFDRFKHCGFDISKFDIKYPNDYKGKNSIANLNRILNYINRFENLNVKKSILYLWGNNGTQKTAIVNYIGKQLLKKYDVLYVTMFNLINSLWDVQRNEDEEIKVNKYLNCDLLIIDEAFDKDKNGLWSSGKQIPHIDNFIRERINKCKGIIFVSNNNINEIIKNGFSIDIQNLIYRETHPINSVLEFKDNYINEANPIPKNIF